MDKQKIVEAIRSENFITVEYKKTKNSNAVTRRMCPYDIYPSNEKKKSNNIKEILLGYEINNSQKGNHVAKIFLDQIGSVDILNEEFDGLEVKKLVKSSTAPHIKREW
jgi:hypothetical protein